MHRSGATMAWNVFKFCTALRGLGSIMILLVLGVVGVTYYAVVLTTYGPSLYDSGLDSLIAVSILILFHCLVSQLLITIELPIFVNFESFCFGVDGFCNICAFKIVSWLSICFDKNEIFCMEFSFLGSYIFDNWMSLNLKAEFFFLSAFMVRVVKKKGVWLGL